MIVKICILSIYNRQLIILLLYDYIASRYLTVKLILGGTTLQTIKRTLQVIIQKILKLCVLNFKGIFLSVINVTISGNLLN